MLGKGIGESILVCLRPGDWVIVDSFRTPGSGNPAAIDYLNGRGVRPETDVAAVILSHLHVDHSDGIDDLLVRCPRAMFSMPAAVPEEHWNRVLERLLSEEPPRSDKLQEIANAFRLAMDTGRFRPMAVDSFVNTEPPELSALAPLAAAQLAAHKATAPAAAAAARAILRENYTSIVLWLRAGAATALFGADMDRHEALGWSALLAEHERTARLAEPARAGQGAASREWACARASGLRDLDRRQPRGAHAKPQQPIANSDRRERTQGSLCRSVASRAASGTRLEGPFCTSFR